tara:strand:- start:1603 stop:2082 length:480 start_codon:yes stop_codon:yes gene_type:complete
MIKEIKIIKDSIFNDHRGSLWTSWKSDKKISINFNHDKFSISKENVFRGLHYDNKTWKLISCVFGKVFFIVVNCKPNSKEYLKVFTKVLSNSDNTQILVPPGFANGHLCLSKKCLFHYKLSYKGEYSDVNNQKVLKWNDPRIKIKWPKTKKFITSERDR